MRHAVVVLTLTLLTVACAMQPRIETVPELAAALKKHGVAFDVTKTESVSAIPVAKIDEGVTLIGENLNVTILRIADPRTYKVATNATFILGFVKSAAPEMPQQPPDIYLSAPFAIIIRSEPTEGAVRAALEKIIPEDVVE